MLRQVLADQAQSHGSEASGLRRTQSGVTRVLLVGPGKRGLGTHIPALASRPEMELVGVVDHGKAGSRVAADLLDTNAKLIDLSDAIEMRPDLAIVATPHESHVTIGARLLRAKIPTIVEKPPARSVAELDRLIRASDLHQTPISTFLPLRYSSDTHPLINRLKRGCCAGSRIEVDATVAPYPGVSSWRNSLRRSGGGIFLDLGYHFVDLLSWCLGTPIVEDLKLTYPDSSHDSVDNEAVVRLQFDTANVKATLRLRASDVAPKQTVISVDGETLLVRDYMAQPSVSYGIDAVAEQLSRLADDGFLGGTGQWRREIDNQRVILGLIEGAYKRFQARSLGGGR